MCRKLTEGSDAVKKYNELMETPEPKAERKLKPNKLLFREVSIDSCLRTMFKLIKSVLVVPL